MEAIISNLIKRFETGSLTRRELIGGLTMLAAAGSSLETAAAQGNSLKATKIDHISVQVNDMQKSLAFYQGVFGLVVVGEDKPNEIVRLGSAGSTRAIVSLHHKSPTAVVDHFAIGVEGFNTDAATQKLKTFGLTPENNLDQGFHVKDPDGVRVQIVGA
jgi:catechol 2,3-dioxygenase-like lactoylglutathione lyase family enzyme